MGCIQEIPYTWTLCLYWFPIVIAYMRSLMTDLESLRSLGLPAAGRLGFELLNCHCQTQTSALGLSTSWRRSSMQLWAGKGRGHVVILLNSGAPNFWSGVVYWAGTNSTGRSPLFHSMFCLNYVSPNRFRMVSRANPNCRTRTTRV
jgi:hypothetical protein